MKYRITQSHLRECPVVPVLKERIAIEVKKMRELEIKLAKAIGELAGLRSAIDALDGNE